MSDPPATAATALRPRARSSSRDSEREDGGGGTDDA